MKKYKTKKDILVQHTMGQTLIKVLPKNSVLVHHSEVSTRWSANSFDGYVCESGEFLGVYFFIPKEENEFYEEI